MKKIVRLTESDLVRLVNRVIKEQRYGSFGDFRKPDSEGDYYADEADRFVNHDIEGIDDDEMYDTEYFDDYESYSKRYPKSDKNSPKWFDNSKAKFDAYRNAVGKPFKVKTRRN